MRKLITLSGLAVLWLWSAGADAACRGGRIRAAGCGIARVATAPVRAVAHRRAARRASACATCAPQATPVKVMPKTK